MMRRRSFFFSVSLVRAMGEMLLLGIVLVGILLLLSFERFSSEYTSNLSRLNIYAIVDPICLCWCAIRWRWGEGSWWWRRVFEAIIGVVLSAALAYGFSLLLMPILILSGDTRYVLVGSMIVLALNSVGFYACRIGARLFLIWNRIRHRQLIWALTYAQVMVAAVGAACLIVAVDLYLIISGRGPSFILISTTIGLGMMSVVTLAAIVPPLALFSYLAMRRTISRLQMLTRATSSLRSGDYGVRVPVIGEDEVAQLQTDFNAMAIDLERAMHELQEERDTVTALLQSRRELIASVSHELRTPVATLRGYLETTLIHWDEVSPPTLHHDLRVMEDEVIQLQKLVEDLFTLARTEVGRLSLQCKPTDVRKIVQHIVDAGAPLVWQKNKIDLVADVPTVLPIVAVDPIRLEQALQNLLHNGVRHTPPGGIIALVVTNEHDMVGIQVKDTGEGIAPNDLLRIWERFYQVESAHTQMGGGAGLGLALVKEWVEAMGGTVTAESVLGEGSCFSIYLPLAPNADPIKCEV